MINVNGLELETERKSMRKHPVTSVNWISTKDELPPIYDKVLFHCIKDKEQQLIYMGYFCPDGWNIYLPYAPVRLTNDSDLIEVTHWAVLPHFPI